MTAGYSILGFYPVEVTSMASFKFTRTWNRFT